MSEENRHGLIVQDFGDGSHQFRLAMGQLEELQEKTGVGPFVLLTRFQSQEWRIQDVSNTIRLGLVGGGMEPIAALNLTRRYVEDRSDWINSARLCYGIMLAALAGAPEEAPGKGGARRGKAARRANSQTENSGSANSTGRRRRSASALPTSAP